MATYEPWLTASTPLILASASPRRRDLLAQIGVMPAEIIPADIDEAVGRRELPRAYATRMAVQKCQTIVGAHPAAAVLAADTVVAVGRRILPKTENRADAEHCLRLLSGRAHKVIGGIALALPGCPALVRVVTSRVTFKVLSEHEIKAYLDTAEWQGKAGGYAIQGRAAAFIQAISGSYSNVVGLSLHESYQLLTGAGFRLGVPAP